MAIVCAFQYAALYIMIRHSLLPTTIRPQPALGLWYLTILALPAVQYEVVRSTYLTWMQAGTLAGVVLSYGISQVVLIRNDQISYALFRTEMIESFFCIPILYAAGSFILCGLQGFASFRYVQDRPSV